MCVLTVVCIHHSHYLHSERKKLKAAEITVGYVGSKVVSLVDIQ